MVSYKAAVSLAAGIVIMAGTAALAAPASAATTTPAPASAATTVPGECYFYDNLYNEPGACEGEETHYSEQGVSVWDNPYSPSTVVAVGSAGQPFATSQEFISNGATVTCDNGVTTSSWYQGEDKASRNEGWVPDCYIDGEPSLSAGAALPVRPGGILARCPR
ncbi:MAG: hypothetical protein JOY82_14015 [Streptosporangiaceae bacterium]|nr:hypothetical protein [Streptosporangiaceae bacterium]